MPTVGGITPLLMRPKILAFVLVVITGATSLSAQTLAFTANGSGERINFGGSLGLFFDLSGR